jgi:SAM-dependent methyltransferase
MKAPHLWEPTKFVQGPRGYVTSGDSGAVGIRSRLITDLMAEAYVSALTEHARGSLVDVGCGKVPLYGVYRDRVSEVVCVDWENTHHPSPHLDAVCDIGQGLPFPDARFDTVVATDVLEHLLRPQAFFGEVSRLLRPGGKLVLGVPFLYWIHEAPHDHFRYTRFALAALCEQSGLEVVSLSEYGGPLAVVLDVVGKLVPTSPLAAGFQALARRFVRSPPGRQLDRARSAEFPLGYCLVARKA